MYLEQHEIVKIPGEEKHWRKVNNTLRWALLFRMRPYVEQITLAFRVNSVHDDLNPK